MEDGFTIEDGVVITMERPRPMVSNPDIVIILQLIRRINHIIGGVECIRSILPIMAMVFVSGVTLSCSDIQCLVDYFPSSYGLFYSLP